MIQNLINESDTYPLFPKSYQINNFDNNYVDHTVKFDNMSYCIDTPKNNDFVIFENCTEKCILAMADVEALRLYMSDENPNKNNIFNP